MSDHLSDLAQPLWLSVRIAVLATAIVALSVIPIAFVVARHRRFRGRSVLESLVLLPLVLPPTVVGYIIILLFGANGLLARCTGWNYSILFRFEGAVLAAAVVAVPMIYLPAKGAFESIDREMEDFAKVEGASPLQIFLHISLPSARRGLLAAIILGFARALGEFGATAMVYGWQPHRVTLPISIYADFEGGDVNHAASAVVVLCLISFSLIGAYNFSSSGRQNGS